MTEAEADGWHHRLKGHELGEALGVVMDRDSWSAAVSSWGCKESDTTERLN